MKTIFRIFRQDVKSLSKNLIIFVVVIGITILPALYAWFNIAANWDPYSNTGELPFAVCSLDKGSSFKGVEIKAGDEIVEGLKANNKMGWQFVDKDDAIDGVKSDKYYAAVIIPEDFSDNLLSISTGKFKQAKLDYYVNEKRNAIAPKITDKGIEAIQESVDSSFVSTLAKTIATTLNISGEELEENKDTLADKIVSALKNAKADIKTFDGSVDLLITTLDSIDSLIKSNKEMGPGLKESLSSVGVVTGDIKSALSSTKNIASQLSVAIDNLLSSGDAYMDDASAKLDEAFSTVSNDANALATKLSKIEVVNQKVIGVNNKLTSIIQAIQSSTGIDCSKILSKIQASTDKQNKIIDKIESICSNIKKTGAAPANAKSEIEGLISEAKTEIAGTSSEFASIKQSLDSALDTSFSQLDDLANFAQTLSLTTDQLDAAFDSGSETVASLKAVLVDLKGYFDDLSERIDNLIKRVDELKNDKTIENLMMPIIEDPTALGEFIAAPVDSESHRIYPLDNYGSAMTPFYSTLALWVGGVVLVAVLNVDLTPKDRKKLGKANSTQLFFGRYIMFFITGQIQALIIALGDLYFLKIQCDTPGLFILACLISSFVYTLLIYSLTITFSVIGKALAVIILVIQVAGSGGTFPVEVLPGPFKAMVSYLPFRYGINALRETVAGVDFGTYWLNIGLLLLFIIPALVLGLLLRKPCIKAIGFFNGKIEDSDLVI